MRGRDYRKIYAGLMAAALLVSACPAEIHAFSESAPAAEHTVDPADDTAFDGTDILPEEAFESLGDTLSSDDTAYSLSGDEIDSDTAETDEADPVMAEDDKADPALAEDDEADPAMAEDDDTAPALPGTDDISSILQGADDTVSGGDFTCSISAASSAFGREPEDPDEPKATEDGMPAEKVTLNETAASLYPGETLKLSAAVGPAGAKDRSVTWSSDEPSVASVDDKGKVTALSAATDASGDPVPATARITATANGSITPGSVKAECVVTVLPSEILDRTASGNIIDPGEAAIKDEEPRIWVSGLDPTGYHYTGYPIKPDIHVYCGYRLLTAGRDYTLSYKNNKNIAGADAVNAKGKSVAPRIIIKMKGAYSGSRTVNFSILPMPIESLSADNANLTAVYRAKKKNMLKPVLMYEGSRIKYGSGDLTFKWYETDASGNPTDEESGCTAPGTYAVKIFAGRSGRFTDFSEGGSGCVIADVTVSDTQVLMSSVKISGYKKSLPYAGGSPVEQTAVLSLKDGTGTHVLSENTAGEPGGDYTVTYRNNRDLGTATVIYEGVKDHEGRYTGRISGRVVKTFKITGKYRLPVSSDSAVNTCSVTLDASGLTYTGAAIRPAVKVTATLVNNRGLVEQRILKEGKDYKLTYRNNKNAASSDAVNPKNGKDMAPQVIIKGKGQYAFTSQDGRAGSHTERFAISPVSLRDLVVTVGDVSYSNKADKYKKTKILFADRNYRDMKLKQGRDYTAEFSTSDGSRAPAAGQAVYVTLRAKQDSEGNYTGNYRDFVNESYRVMGKYHTNIAKATVVVNPNTKGKAAPCVYTGRGIEPVKGGTPDLLITVGKGKSRRELVPGSREEAAVTGDYEILGYYNNTASGKNAVMLIRGIGDFRGIRAVKFRISNAPVSGRWGGVVYGDGSGTGSKPYGVFLGLSDEDVVEKTEGYGLIAIEGQDISAGTVRQLKEAGHTVYGYLSIGSLEKYRPYYDRFKNLALGEYDNWPDEYWVDVSKTEWQKFLVSEIAPDMKAKGFDGFFLDNADVYYHYNTSEIYGGLQTIITGLRALNMDIMINGGDTFVKKLMKEGKAGLIDAVNQETVFSSIINYKKDIFGRQPTEENQYFREYLAQVASAGIDVYLLEYTRDNTLTEVIKAYCRSRGYGYYISGRVNLT